jgi:hypothetical protein
LALSFSWLPDCQFAALLTGGLVHILAAAFGLSATVDLLFGLIPAGSCYDSSPVPDHQIQLGLMIVNSLTFLALVCYTVETMRLRRAARDQVEGMSKP